MSQLTPDPIAQRLMSVLGHDDAYLDTTLRAEALRRNRAARLGYYGDDADYEAMAQARDEAREDYAPDPERYM